MPDLLPHLRREMHALERLAEKYRADGSAFADLVDGDIAVLAAKVAEAERVAAQRKAA
jgi:hypothetical protein